MKRIQAVSRIQTIFVLLIITCAFGTAAYAQNSGTLVPWSGQFSGFGLILTLLATLGALGAFGFVIFQRFVKGKKI